MTRWLESCEGRHVDSVIHEFVRAKWVPRQFRQAHKLGEYLEMNTFIENGKVCFYDNYPRFSYKNEPYVVVEDTTSKTFYVHPETRKVCVYRPQSRKSWGTTYREKINSKLVILGDYHQYYKLDGIWYEVKAEPIATHPMHIAPCWGAERKGPRDILLEKNDGFHNRYENLPFVRITLKRQLSHEELVENTLFNDHPFLHKQKPCPKCGGVGKSCRHNSV